MNDFELLREEYGRPVNEQIKALQEQNKMLVDSLHQMGEALGVRESFGNNGMVPDEILLAIENLNEKAGVLPKVAKVTGMIKTSRVFKIAIAADAPAPDPASQLTKPQAGEVQVVQQSATSKALKTAVENALHEVENLHKENSKDHDMAVGYVMAKLADKLASDPDKKQYGQYDHASGTFQFKDSVRSSIVNLFKKCSGKNVYGASNMADSISSMDAWLAKNPSGGAMSTQDINGERVSSEGNLTNPYSPVKK